MQIQKHAPQSREKDFLWQCVSAGALTAGTLMCFFMTAVIHD